MSHADDRSFSLSAPPELVETGLLKFFVPRFSLKHAVRVEIVDDESAAVARLNRAEKGQLVFSGLQRDWYIEVVDGTGTAAAKRFEEWLAGSVGQKTIASFKVDGEQAFLPAAIARERAVAPKISGDAVVGEALAVRHCGRCHMVNEKTRLTTIGSTPSFALLRGFPDWNDRFEAFFVLRPHPAFTIVEDVTEPFDKSRPSPIVPITVTLKDIKAILAYVSEMTPADLGSPLKLQ